MLRFVFVPVRSGLKRQLMCSVFVAGMLLLSALARAETEYTAALQEILQNDPTHFNERMWNLIRANPDSQQQIFNEAVRLSLRHEIALHPDRKEDILARFKKLYPQLAEDLEAYAAGHDPALRQVASFNKPTKLHVLADDPEYAPGSRSSWMGRNWPWVLLGGAAAVGGVVAIAASGGGDGDDAPAVDYSPPPNVGAQQEYANQYGLEKIGAGAANLEGYTGADVTVAVIDSGVNVLHPDLEDNIVAGGYDFINNTATVTDTDALTYHGTHVAGVIAASKNDFGMRGVAYGAKILPIAAIGSGAPSTAIVSAVERAINQGADIINASYGPSDIATELFVQNGAQFFWQAALDQADAYLNFANNGGILVFAAGNEYSPSTASITNNPTGGGFLPFIRPSNANIALGQPGAYRYSEDGVTLTTLNADYSALEGNLIAAVAVDEDNIIASFSNRCGVAKDWCVAAPGVAIYSTGATNTYSALSGTSFAAPHVAGALAVLKHQHPELTSEQIVNLLLDTATDLGTAGVDEIYGHGLINLDAAVQSVGPFSVVMGSSMFGGASLLNSSSIISSPAFGGDVIRQLGQTRIGVLDSYTRNFSVTLAQRVNARLTQVDAMTALQRFGQNEYRPKIALGADSSVSFTLKAKGGGERVADSQGLSKTFDSYSFTHKIGADADVTLAHRDARANALAFNEDDRTLLSSQVSSGGIGNPYLDFISEGYAQNVTVDLPWEGRFRATTAMGGAEGDSSQNNMLAMGEAGFGDARTGVTFSSGALIEQNRVLGLRGEGAFEIGGGSTTWFGGVAGRWQLASNTQLLASFHAGMTEASAAGHSLVQGIDRIATTSWRVGLTQSEVLQESDRLRFNVSQPLRAESGAVNLALPQYRLRDGTMIRKDARYDLAPSGREIDVEAGYSFDVDDATRLDFAALYRHDAGHVAGQNEAIGLTRVNRGF